MFVTFRPKLDDEVKEEIEDAKKFYRQWEKDKKKQRKEFGEDFKLENMKWRRDNKQFDVSYIILKALREFNEK